MNSLYCTAGMDGDKWLVKKDYAAWLPSNNRSLAGSYDDKSSTRHQFQTTLLILFRKVITYLPYTYWLSYSYMSL